MSYDVYVGGSEKDLNYTSNVRTLFYDHIPDNGKGGGLRELHKTPNTEVVEIMSKFFDSVEDARRNARPWDAPEVVGEPELSEKYDVKNGWGSLIGALVFAAQIMGEAAKFPESFTEVSM